MTITVNAIEWQTTTFAKTHGVHLTDAVGLIPAFFDPSDARDAREQIEDNYAHGGGWRPHPTPEHWTFDPQTLTVTYDDKDPYEEPEQYHALASAKLPNGQAIIVFQSAWLLVVDPDGKWQIARVD